MALYDDYSTRLELKSYLRIPDAADSTDQVDDAELTFALTAASRAVDRATNRQFGLAASASARYYTPKWDTPLKAYTVRVFDFMTVTGLVVKSDLDGDGTYETTITDFYKTPFNAAADSEPWTGLVFGTASDVTTEPNSLEVTARWGWTTVPVTIEQATLLQAARFFKRRDAPFGIAGSPDMGSEMRLLAQMDPDVKVMLGSYRRLWGAR